MPFDHDRDTQLRARIGVGVAHDVVGVGARVWHQRGHAGARDAAVDAFIDALLDEQELGHHLGQRSAAREQAQRAVAGQTLDRGEIERERAVQLLHDERGHLGDVAGRRQPRGQAGGDLQLGAQVGELAGGRELTGAIVGAMPLQRLGASASLARARAVRRREVSRGLPGRGVRAGERSLGHLAAHRRLKART